MGIISIIDAFLKLFVLWLNTKLEKDAERKKLLEKAQKDLHEGIKNRDASAVTIAFTRVRNK